MKHALSKTLLAAAIAIGGSVSSDLVTGAQAQSGIAQDQLQKDREFARKLRELKDRQHREWNKLMDKQRAEVSELADKLPAEQRKVLDEHSGEKAEMQRRHKAELEKLKSEYKG